MNESFFNTAFYISFLSKKVKFLLTLLFVLVQTVAFGQIVNDYRSNGNVTFAAATNWQRYNGSNWVNATIAPNVASYTTSNTITVRSGNAATISITATIAAQLTVEGIFTLNNSANLSIGSIMVDNNGTPFTVSTGSALTVNGNFTVKKGDMSVAGTIYIDGNFSTTTGNVDVVGGGSMASSGSMTTQGSGTIFGSTGDCPLPGPCSGTSLNCPSTISPPSQTVCANSQSAPITFTLSGATVEKWQSTTDFLTFTDIANTTTTLPAQTVTQTTRFRAVYLSSGCTGNVNSPFATVTVNPAPTAPTASAQSFCDSATVASLVGTAPSGSVVDWYAAATGGSVLATTTTLTTGSYFAQSRNTTTGCVSATRTAVSVIINTTNTWTGATDTSWFTLTNWSCGNVPTVSSDVIIPNNVSNNPVVDGTNTTALANTLTVNSGSSLTTNSGNTLKVTNAVSNNGGTITFENSASLVQINNITNSGNIIYKRDYTGGEMDYTYWSSPVALQNLLALSPSTKLDKFFSYDGTDWVQENPATTSMKEGKGYTIRGIPPPSGPPPGFDTLSFVGVPNNGNYEISSIVGDRSYLLGNPYASALDADAFLIANKDVINGTLYFWTHNTPIAIGTPDPGSGIWAYSGNDYAAYNATGGVAAINPPDIDPVTGQPYPAQAPSGGAVPSGKIASGQGFFGSSKGSLPTNPKIVYDNTMRVGVGGISGNNSQFFKIKNTKVTSPIEKHRIWLDLTNVEGAFKQTLVGYVTGATNDYDDRFDGESYDGNDFLDFYSINDEKNLTIQGRALPFNENDEVPLGYRVALGGTFTLKVGQKDGLLSNVDMFLEDKLTNTVTNLKSGNYTFNTAAGTFNDRFVLRYTNKTLGTTDFDVKGKSVLVSIKNKQIKINSFGETIEKVTIFDLLGRQIYQKDKINSNELVLADFRANHEALIVKTSLQNGKVVSEKIIF